MVGMTDIVQPPDGEPDALHQMSDAETSLARRLADALVEHDAARPRSLQEGIGASGLGAGCDRRLAYTKAGVGREDNTASLPAIIGTAVHAHIENILANRPRYIIEGEVEYRGIPGNLDAYDTIDRVAIDWKTTKRDNIRKWRRDGVPTQYQIQAQTYAAGLSETGKTPRHVAIVAIPTDASMDYIHAWVWPFERAIADTAIDRWENIPDSDPDSVPRTVTYKCKWCPFQTRCNNQGD